MTRCLHLVVGVVMLMTRSCRVSRHPAALHQRLHVRRSGIGIVIADGDEIRQAPLAPPSARGATVAPATGPPSEAWDAQVEEWALHLMLQASPSSWQLRRRRPHSQHRPLTVCTDLPLEAQCHGLCLELLQGWPKAPLAFRAVEPIHSITTSLGAGEALLLLAPVDMPTLLLSMLVMRPPALLVEAIPGHVRAWQLWSTRFTLPPWPSSARTTLRASRKAWPSLCVK